MPLPLPDAAAIAALSAVPTLGAARIGRLLATNPRPRDLLHLSSEAFLHVGVSENELHILTREALLARAEVMAARLTKDSIDVMLVDDPGFPRLLKEIGAPPSYLFFRGICDGSRAALSIVGSRRPSPYGREMTTRIASGLAQSGLVVVSGLALGIDGLAHTAACDAGGVTWAFVGASIDDETVYPRAHTSLAARIIASGGCLFSEWPPGTFARQHFFPQRNRLIAGASLGTLIVEAAEKSGSLITATLALENNREVGAVPGDATRLQSAGTNALLRRGAHVITSAADFLDACSLAKTTDATPTPLLSGDQARIHNALAAGGCTIDDLTESLSLSAPAVAMSLTSLEIAGLIHGGLGGTWLRTGK